MEGSELERLIDQAIPKQQALKLDASAYRALIAPGGSLLQDATSVRSLLYYLWIIRRFLIARIPVYLLNQGIGPLNSWVADIFTPRYLRRVTMLSMRDQDSFVWAQGKRILAAHPELYLASDPMLAPPFAVETATGMQPSTQEGYALVIAKPTRDLPHPGDETSEEKALAVLIRQIRRTTGHQVLVTGLHEHQDRGFCERAAAQASECASYQALPEGAGSYNALLALIAGAKLVLSYRLHGLVSAVAYGVPAMGVAYDPKIIAFCMESALPYCFPATVHEDAAQQDLRRLWRDRAEVIDVLTERRQSMLKRLQAAEERFNALW
jgi:polysaccharide pyruvyl transferase CsaB